jgi:hypothetical protein
MLPSILIEGTRVPMAVSDKFWIILGTTPLSITACILFLFASLWYEMAQQQSAIIYLSFSLPEAMQAQSNGMAIFIFSYLGSGLPLHRLEIAQHPCLIKV